MKERDEGSYVGSGRVEKGELTERLERRHIESDAAGVEIKGPSRVMRKKIKWIKCRGVT